MLLTYEIKDAHASEFVRMIGKEPGTVEENNATLNTWLKERTDPVYEQVIKNFIDQDSEVLAKEAELKILRATKEQEAKDVKPEGESDKLSI